MTSIALYLGMCVAAALAVVDHFVLAWRARRRGVARPVAWLLPAVAAWRTEAYGAAVRYGVWVTAYAALAITARVLAAR